MRALEAVTVDMVREGGRLDFRPIPGTEFTLPADLVLLAMGFVGPERKGPIDELNLALTERVHAFHLPCEARPDVVRFDPDATWLAQTVIDV